MRAAIWLLATFAPVSLPARAQCVPAEVAALTASNNQLLDNFGQEVAVWDDVAFVGALGASPTSSVYVYERDSLDAHRWNSVAQLVGPGPSFGRCIAAQNDLVAIGYVNSRVYLHARNAGGPNAWGLVKVLDNGVQPANADGFGTSIAISGDTIAVGAPLTLFNEYGAVHIFRRDAGGPGNWGRVKKLLSPLPNSVSQGVFGVAVALHGDTLIASDTRIHSFDGDAYVFERDLGGAEQWGLAKVLAPQFDNVDNESAGTSVAIHGDRAMVGVPYLPTGGAVRIYERDLGGANNWGLAQTLGSNSGSTSELFGWAIDFDGARAAIGAKHYGAAASALGRVYVVEPLGTGASTWQHTAVLEASDARAGDTFGMSVSLWRNTVVAGNDRNNFLTQGLGKVHVFDLESPAPPVSYCTAGTSSRGCSGVLLGVGGASASDADGFELVAIGVDAQRNGAVFYGVSGAQALPTPGTSSWRCVRSPLQRLGIASSAGTSGACDGSLRVDWNAFRAANPGALGAPFSAGQTLWAQAWWRDAAGGVSTQGLEFSLCP